MYYLAYSNIQHNALRPHLNWVLLIKFQSHADLEDPVRFVFRTWPWREDVAGLPQALRPVIGQAGEGTFINDVLEMSIFLTSSSFSITSFQNIISTTKLTFSQVK